MSQSSAHCLRLTSCTHSTLADHLTPRLSDLEARASQINFGMGLLLEPLFLAPCREILWARRQGGGRQSQPGFVVRGVRGGRRAGASLNGVRAAGGSANESGGETGRVGRAAGGIGGVGLGCDGF